MSSKSPIEFLHPVGDFALSISSSSTTTTAAAAAAAATPFKMKLASSFVTTFAFESTSLFDKIAGSVGVFEIFSLWFTDIISGAVITVRSLLAGSFQS